MFTADGEQAVENIYVTFIESIASFKSVEILVFQQLLDLSSKQIDSLSRRFSSPEKSRFERWRQCEAEINTRHPIVLFAFFPKL